MPANAGIQVYSQRNAARGLDSRFHGNDGSGVDLEPRVVQLLVNHLM